MKVVCYTIAFFTLLIPSLEAQERGVVIRLCGPEIFETEPGSIVTAVFQITNETAQAQEFFSDVKLPQGWMLIVEDPSFCLGPHVSDARLVSFWVPQGALAGEYALTYCITGRKFPSMVGAYTIKVSVLPVSRLEVTLLQAPDIVIAGEDYRISFVVTNKSNTKGDVVIMIDSGEDLPFAVDTEKLQLAPEESKTLEVVVKTDRTRKTKLKHHLRFTAQMFENQGTKAQASSHVEILPRTTGSGERYLKVPAELALKYVTKRNFQDDAGFQAAISGSGTLDEERRKGIDFYLRGPDVQDKSSFGLHDEYRVTFHTKAFELRFGDQVYGASQLIEKHVYGRGAEGSLSLSDIRVGGYHMETRWLEPKAKHTAGYLDYLAWDTFQIGLNYLHREKKDADEKIASLECRLRPFAKTDLELEYSKGERNRERGDAYQLGVSSRWNWISYASRFVHAEPQASAYHGNRDFASAGFSVRLRQNLKLTANLQQEKQNLNLDPMLHSAPVEQFYKLGFDYRINFGTSFYVNWQNRRREDRLPDPGFRYRERSILLGIGQTFQKIGFRIYGESGTREDELANQSTPLVNYKLYTHAQPLHILSASGYFYSDESGDSSKDRRRRITAGLNGSLRIADRMNLSLNFQTSAYRDSDHGNRNILEVSFRHRFHNQSEIRLRGRRMSYRDLGGRYESDVMAEYIIPLGLPVARRGDIGRVRGSVYDQESNQPISDVILRIDGTTAVTDKRGEFNFSSVKPGTHYLSLSTARIGLDRIAAQKIPMELNIQGGEETQIEVGITRAASLSGHVHAYSLANGVANGYGDNLLAHVNGNNGNNHHVIGAGNHNDFWNNGSGHNVIGDGSGNGSSLNGTYDTENLTSAKVHGVSNVLVELTDGLEVMRRLTDREGRFAFEEVRPGQWTLKIHQNNLPTYHHLERDTFNFHLAPGEKDDVLIRVVPKLRPIQIISEGEIKLEEEK